MLRDESRKHLIEALKAEDPVLHGQFLGDSRRAEGESHLMRNSGCYPLCGRGDINVYTIFGEGMRNLLGAGGAMGAILPSGLATDDTTRHFFSDLSTSKSLWSFYEFENEGFFPSAGQGHMVRFALTTIRGRSRCAIATDFVFQAKAISDLAAPDLHFALSAEDIELLNPNTRTCPIFRSRHDAELTKGIYRRVPVLIRQAHDDRPEENPWGISFSTMFHLANDSHLFRTRDQLEAEGWRLSGNIFNRSGLEYLPLYEAKMAQIFNHRAGSFEKIPTGERAHVLPRSTEADLANPYYTAHPYYWVASENVNQRLASYSGRGWLWGWRDVADARASARATVVSLIPEVAVNHKLQLVFCANGHPALLYAILASFAFDYLAKQKLSGLSFSYFILKQLPVFAPDRLDQFMIAGLPLTRFVLSRALELTYTAWDLEPFARDCGWSGPPFHWDEDRRFLLRCELDAAFFHLYMPAASNCEWSLTETETAEELARLKTSFPTPRDAVSYIMDTFPIVMRKDKAQWGEYRTKRIILEMYDAMAKVAHTGIPYQTRLDPPPADQSCRHLKRNVGILAFGSLITDPGPELEPRIATRIKTKTPFPVEYARISRTRGDAPTLVPHELGAPVSAEILVLDNDISIEEAKNMLWRRERRAERTDETYSRGTGDNCVLVEEFHDDPCVTTALYTDFNASGKIPHPTAADLATKAIESVAAAPEGRDGITYLMSAVQCGIETPLTADYKAEILKQTMTLTLEEALKTAKDGR